MICFWFVLMFDFALADTSQIKMTVEMTEKKQGLPKVLLSAVIWQESSFRPRAFNGSHNPGVAVSSYGLGQLTLDTAKWHCNLEKKDILNTAKNLTCSARVLKYQLKRYDGDLDSAISAYNMGTPCICNGKHYIKSIRGVVKDCRHKKTLLPLACSIKGRYWNQKYVSDVLGKMQFLKAEKVVKEKPSLALQRDNGNPFEITLVLHNFYGTLLKKFF